MRIVLLVLSVILFSGCYSKNKQSAGTNPGTKRTAAEKPESLDQKLRRCRALAQQGKGKEALKVVREILLASPDNPQALGLAIQIQRSLRQYCEAADLAMKVARSDPKLAGMAIQAFELYLRCGNFEAAEKSVRELIQQNANHAEAHRLLAQLLTAQGRRVESSEHVRQLIRLRSVQPNEVLSLIDLSGPFSLVSYGDVVNPSVPSLFSLGKARELSVGKPDPEELLAAIAEVRKDFPDSPAAAAFQGRIFSELGRMNDLQSWLKNLPEGIQKEPEYWQAVGSLLATQQKHEQAIRAFAEALRLDPTSRESMRSMISSLDAIGKEEIAARLRKTLGDLDKIFRIARDSDAEQAIWISGKLQELVRPWESAAWLMRSAQQSGQLSQRIPELNQRQAAILAWEKGSTLQQVQAARLKEMLGFPADEYPLPDLASLQTSSAPRQSIVNSGLKFSDVAPQLGLNSRLISGFPVQGTGDFHIYHPNGGGLAVIDYDLDGYCDLYAAQSGGKPNQKTGSSPNELFRFLGGEKFTDVAAITGTDDRSFGQGVCVGDANQDGFPDLIVANIGKNLLYINQGDGTFRNASELIGGNKDDWTSTIGLADLDGDHLPELIEVNYIDDPPAFKVTCQDDYDKCQPQRFNTSADRVLLGSKTGGFTPWKTICGQLRESPNLGFGLVIANFDRNHGNDYFVANDGDFNDYWVSRESTSDASRYEIVETGNLSGCSIGRGGNSQACMGVGSGDFDRNGTLDLHVTNFRKEPVNLFLQTRSGNFSDEALTYGLFEASFPVLGWGTQAADFDNSGWLDLAVVNGHVFDERSVGTPFEMQPQLFLGGRRGFVVHDSSAGEYWQNKFVGRTLLTLDFNRDGRMDLLANHIDAPTALLQNDTEAQSWIQLELIGVESERDAIGAVVEVEVGKQRWTGWQIAGDGHMCTNEPIVHFGIGQATFIDRITVTWPSGKEQKFEDVTPDSRYLLTEGGELFRR